MDLVPSYGITSLPLFKPDLNEFAPKLKNALSKLYKQVEVTVVDCPDLTKKPFTLAGKALGGRKVMAVIGGVRYFMPFPPQPMPTYSLVNLAQKIDFSRGHILGAGCAPAHLVGAIGEYIPNVFFTPKDSSNKTQIIHGSYISTMSKDLSHTLKSCDIECVSLFADLFICESLPGKVLKVQVKRRTHEDGKSFSCAIQKVLAQLYPNSSVSMGGVFAIKSGTAKIHVMPSEFGKNPLDQLNKFSKWLNFFHVEAPLVCLSSFHSYDPGLDIRLEHTHCFSHHGQGGHYYHDTSPLEIEYEGYFDFCDQIFRIDRPEKI